MAPWQIPTPPAKNHSSHKKREGIVVILVGDNSKFTNKGKGEKRKGYTFSSAIHGISCCFLLCLVLSTINYN